MKDLNYYNIFGISKDAGIDEVKSAYRNLALKYHPDISNDNDDKKFIIITDIYNTLKNEEKRKTYDQILNAKKKEASFHKTRVDPIFELIIKDYNFLLWDLSDFIQKIPDEKFNDIINENKCLYDLFILILKELESTILNENYRYLGAISKKSKRKINIEIYYYSLRIELENRINKLSINAIDKNELEIIINEKNKLVSYIQTINEFIGK